MKQKNAFSLIEVLLVTAIIAVVTAMGFSISKSGMEKAYNLYWYTGYSTLNDVTYDAIKKHKVTLTSEEFVFCDYSKHLHDMIILKDNNFTCDESTESVTIAAANGITYTVSKTQEADIIKINMAVPHAQKTNAKTNTDFILNMNNDFYSNIGPYIYIYPAKTPGNLPSGYLGLQERADLLPFYIKTSSATGIQNFYSFRAAYCKLHGQSYIDNNLEEVNVMCNETTPTATGSLRHISPRKAY